MAELRDVQLRMEVSKKDFELQMIQKFEKVCLIVLNSSMPTNLFFVRVGKQAQHIFKRNVNN